MAPTNLLQMLKESPTGKVEGFWMTTDKAPLSIGQRNTSVSLVLTSRMKVLGTYPIKRKVCGESTRTKGTFRLIGNIITEDGLFAEITVAYTAPEYFGRYQISNFLIPKTA